MTTSSTNTPAALESSSPVAWLFLLTITAPGEPPLRVVNNAAPIMSRGLEFVPYPFDIVLPADDSDTLPQLTLRISNLDAAIVEFVRESIDPPSIAVELVTSAFPDFVEQSFTFLKLVSVTYDAMELSGRLDVDNFLSQRFCSEGYTPPQFPGLFRAVLAAVVLSQIAHAFIGSALC
jgi:hypothetical protein